MKAFKTNISDLQKVKVGKPGQGQGQGQASDKYKVLPDDADEGNDGDSKDGDSKQGNEPKPGSIPTVSTQGSAAPIIDIIPDDTTFEEMFGDAEVLPGSDGTPGGKGDKPVMTREAMRQAIEQANKDQEAAIKEASKSRGQGKGGKRIGVPADFPTKTDWARILKNLISETRPGRATFSKIKKSTFGQRFGGVEPIMLPGRGVVKDIGKIIVAIDTSGSISDSIMNGFLSELKKIYNAFSQSKTFAVKVILWTDGPYADSPDFGAKDFNKLKQWTNQNFSSGGTSMDPVVQFINSKYNNGDYVGNVWFTDGQVENLKTQLPDAFQFVVINGYQPALVGNFIADMNKLKPRNKKLLFLRTDYK
jgi:predicted metal-dependent peptidase